MLSRIVGALGTTSEDDMNVLVTGGLDNSSKALLGDTHEGMRVGGRLHSVDGNANASVSSWVEQREQDV